MLLDARIRAVVYRASIDRGTRPTIDEISSAVSASRDDVAAALARLASARMLVLQPSTGEILMAPPFSAVPTPFLVQTAPHESYANCMWDALGVPIMMRTPGRIRTSCGCCGDEMIVDAPPDRPPAQTGLVHFAIPAARWWADIVFT